MNKALEEAQKAFSKDEIPIGAVIVFKDKIIGYGHNLVENTQNPLLHAEIVALNMAFDFTKNKFLNECDIYVTVEPCVMCIGAIINSRIKNLYFGSFQPKFGACGSLFNIPESNKLNHKINVYSGLLAEDSEKLLENYFVNKR